MGNSTQSLTIVIPVIAVLAAGFFSKKYKLIKTEGINGLRIFITTIALPAAMFRAIASMSISGDVFIVAVVIFLTDLFVLFIGLLINRIFPKTNRMLPFLITCFEAGMLGYPLYTMLFGMGKLSSAIVIALGSDIFVFSIYSAILKHKEGLGGMKEAFHDMLRSPIFLSIIFGILFSSFNLYGHYQNSAFIVVFFSVLDFFGKPVACVMLFVIGFEISFSKQNSVQVLSTCIIRLIIMGTMSIFVIRLLTSLIEMDNYLITAVRLLFFLPAPYILPIFTQNEENRTFTSTVLSVNLLFSMVAFAIIAFQNAI